MARSKVTNAALTVAAGGLLVLFAAEVVAVITDALKAPQGLVVLVGLVMCGVGFTTLIRAAARAVRGLYCEAANSEPEDARPTTLS